MKNANARQIINTIDIRVGREAARLRKAGGHQHTVHELDATRHDLNRLRRVLGILHELRAGRRAGSRSRS
jgi:hypothetical protein